MINLEEQYQALAKALDSFDVNLIQDTSKHINPADIATFTKRMNMPQQVKLFQSLPNSAYVLEYLSLAEQVNIARHLENQYLIKIISEMHSDSRVDLMKALPLSLQKYIYNGLEPDKRAEIKSLEIYAEESAGAIMSSDFVTLPPELTMQQAIDQLRHEASDSETLYLIYITNYLHQLEGVISLRQIIQSAPEQVISEVMNNQVITGLVDEDQELIAKKLSHYDFIALPIVDAENHLLGIVTYDDAMDILQQEFNEDALKGSAVESSPNISLKSAPIFSLYKKRVFWLVLLVFGSLLSGIGISHFEDIIAAHIVLVFFLPLLVGSGGECRITVRNSDGTCHCNGRCAFERLVLFVRT